MRTIPSVYSATEKTFIRCANGEYVIVEPLVGGRSYRVYAKGESVRAERSETPAHVREMVQARGGLARTYEHRAPALVSQLLETDSVDDIDPKSYAGALRVKRDIVKDLIKQHAVSHQWERDRYSGEAAIVSFPKEVDFAKLLTDHGVPPSAVIGITRGIKNLRLRFYWRAGQLDKLA